MHITHSLTYPLSPAILVDVLTDPAFIESRFSCLDVQPHITVEHVPQDGCRLVRTECHITSQALPANLRHFTPDSLTVVAEENYTPEGDERWNVSTSVKVHGLPIDATIQSVIEPYKADDFSPNSGFPLAMNNPSSSGTQGGARQQIEGNLRVNIPFFGRKVEAVLAENVARIAEKQLRDVRDWAS